MTATTKHLASAIATASILTSGVFGINLLAVTTQQMPAVAQTACNAIRYVNFSATAASSGVNVRSSPSLGASIIARLQPNERRSFDAWTYGDAVNDIWTNQPDARWYKLSGQNAWVASAVVIGNAPNSTPLCSNGNSRIIAALDKLNGMYAITDPNGYYPGQCVSFIKRFTKELGITMGPTGGNGGAKYGFINFNQPGLSLSATQANRINFTGSEQPQIGDIIFFDATSTNAYGHVAVVQSVVGNGKVIIQESNANGKAPNTYVTRGEINLKQNPPKPGYGRVMGWLRLKM